MPLDPTQFAEVITIYASEIDSLIENLGKTVTLYFPNTVVSNDSPQDDPISGGIRRPDYKTTNPQVITPNTLQLKALIKYNPTDFQHFGIKIDKPVGLLRLKTYLTDVPNLVKAEYVVPNDASRGIIDTKYKLIREPIPQGLGRDRYAISFWERA